jgi:hypothetical protein
VTDLKPGRFYYTRSASGGLIIIHEPTIFERDTSVTGTFTHTYPDETFTIEERYQFWNAYLDAREGTYDFRCRRYDAVIDTLDLMGMRQADTIADIGAGRGEFGKRLREHGHVGMYVPIDGSIDGCDLNTWDPPDKVDWAVSIETIEHLHDPGRLMARMKIMARFGAVVTTPNADAVDVLAMDPTHLVPLTRQDVALQGWQTEVASLFTDLDDTIIGWFDHRHLARAATRKAQ